MPAAAVEVGRNNTLLFLGKMSPGKGLELLLDAFASLGRGDHQLLAVGSGRLRDAFERDASARGLDNVHINTHLPTWEIPCLLRNVRAVVVPECGFSVTEHYSRVPQEAWACGCTAVVSNRRTAPPRDSAGMVYVDPCNTAAFASALKQLLSTPSPPLGEQDKELRASITAQQYGAYIDRAEQMLAEITAAGEEAG
jgi:glycosyltransferase involved in cell wall biosynthesis